MIGTISAYHMQLAKAGSHCTGSLGECQEASRDISFRYSLSGLSYFELPHFYQGSTPVTTKMHRGGNSVGECWEDGPSKQKNTQRPAL